MTSALALKMNQKDECFGLLHQLRWLDMSWFCSVKSPSANLKAHKGTLEIQEAAWGKE